VTHVPTNLHGAFNGGTVTETLNLAPTTDETPLFASVPNGAISRVVEFDCAPNKPGYMYYDADGTLTVQSPNGVPAIRCQGASGGVADILTVYTTGGARAFFVPGGGGINANPITSGALPTVAPVSGAAFQCSTVRDIFLVAPCTFNPTAGAAATVLVQLSPDNVTYSTLGTLTVPIGLTFDGEVKFVQVAVPAAWYVKLTATNAVLGTGTYY